MPQKSTPGNYPGGINAYGHQNIHTYYLAIALSIISVALWHILHFYWSYTVPVVQVCKAYMHIIHIYTKSYIYKYLSNNIIKVIKMILGFYSLAVVFLHCFHF